MPPAYRPGESRVDRRYGYIRGLARSVQQAALAAYREHTWLSTCKWIAQLALCEVPIHSSHAAKAAQVGMGDVAKARLDEIDSSYVSFAPPPRGIYCSAAAAMLVALLEHAERVEDDDDGDMVHEASATAAPVASAASSKDARLCPRGQLLLLAAAKCEQSFRPWQEHLDALQSGGARLRCGAFQQSETLKNMGLVEKRERKKLCPSGMAYEVRHSCTSASHTGTDSDALCALVPVL